MISRLYALSQPIKLSTWRQPTPKEQFNLILDTIFMCIDHIRNKQNIEIYVKRLEESSQELKQLEYFLVNPKEW